MKILTIEDPKDARILRKVSKRLKDVKKDLQSPDMIMLIQAMRKICSQPNVAGIAANQLGFNIRIFALNFTHGTSPVFFINPKILSEGTEKVSEDEGCLSVPGKGGKVSRANEIELEWRDEHNQKLKHTFKGFFAKAVQHELGHLNGELYIDHVEGELFSEDDMKQRFIEAQERTKEKSELASSVHFVKDEEVGV